MSKIVNISVKDENVKWWDEFDEMRWKDRKSLSSFVQEACKEYYQRHKGAENPQSTIDFFNFKARWKYYWMMFFLMTFLA